GRDLALALTGALHAGYAGDRERARGLAFALVGELAGVDPVACWTRGVVAGGAWSMPGRASRGVGALGGWVWGGVGRGALPRGVRCRFSRAAVPGAVGVFGEGAP